MENHIGPEIGVKFRWDKKPSTVPRQLNSLKEKKRYIACFLVFKPERLAYAIFSKNPYFYGQSMIAVHKSNPLRVVKKPSDISHLVFGFVQKTYITPFMRDPAIKLDLVGSPNFQEINLKKLLSHRIDGIYSPGKGSTLVLLQKYGLTDEFRIIALPEKPSPVHVAFSKDLQKVAESFDEAFDKLGGQKLYLRLLNRYIDVSTLRHTSEKPE